MKELFQYIMVTQWDSHWDKLSLKSNNSSLFTLPMIEDRITNGAFPEEAATLFIKLNRNNQFEKSWIGISKKFHSGTYKSSPAICFEVSDLEEIDCPEEYKIYPKGWYFNKHRLSLPEADNTLHPPFFARMAKCDWKLFEDYTFMLLRLLGIHELHRFPQVDNRGKADGFFKVGSLSVLYDATLELNIEQVKGTQLENFIHQLKIDPIKINEKLSYTIKENDRQVWIITRGATIRSIKVQDQIEVKEIPYTKLIEIYDRRLMEECTTLKLSRLLRDLISV